MPVDAAQLRELVVAGLDLRYKYGLGNENPDDLIARKGWRYIEELERDSHLSSVLATRRQKLIEKGWKIEPAVSPSGKVTARDQEIADFVNWSIDDMIGSLEKDIEGMLDALGKGFSLTEINYKLLNTGKYAGKVGLKSLRFKPARYFSFRFDNFGHYTIVQIDPDPKGTVLPRDKFVHVIAGFNDENPYGDGLTSKCAFWVWLKKNQAKFWAIFNERFGMPLVKVTVPRNATADEESRARSLIEEIQTRAGIKVPEEFNIDFLEAARRGDITYDNFIERCNKEISKVVLGQTLTSEEGKRGQGSYALSTTHSEVLETYTIFDSVITATAINEQLIKRLVNLNYVTDRYPRFRWSGISISSLISFAQAVTQLAQAGVKIPQAWIHERIGIPVARDGEATLTVMPAQGGAQVSQIGVDNRAKDFREDLLPVNFDELPDEVKDEVIEAELLRRRYVSKAAAQSDEIMKKIAASLKKKR
jgi:phage gp29-like protein